MRGQPRKHCRKFPQVQPIPPLKPRLPDPMLLGMVRHTKADHPFVGRLQPNASIGSLPDMRTFDRQLSASGHAAVMPTNPGAVSRTGSSVRLLAGAVDPLREKRARQEPARIPWPWRGSSASPLAYSPAMGPCPAPRAPLSDRQKPHRLRRKGYCTPG